MSKVTKEITVTLKNGKRVTAEYTAIFVYDGNYGADADGNRGIGTWFIDDGYPESPLEVDDDDVILMAEETEEAEQLMFDYANDNFDPEE